MRSYSYMCIVCIYYIYMYKYIYFLLFMTYLLPFKIVEGWPEASMRPALGRRRMTARPSQWRS